MSRPSPIVCDGPGCAKHKLQSNHWWTIQTCSGNASILMTAGTIDTSQATPEDQWKAFDACGQDCALKIISEQMGKVTS